MIGRTDSASLRSRPLRIIQAVTRRQLRGAEVFAGQLAEGLADHGHTVAYLSLYAHGLEGPAPAGVEVVDLEGRQGRGLSPILLASTTRFLRSWRPSVVQANGSDTLKYLLLARWLARSRSRLVYRNISIASAWLRGPVHHAWNRWLARRTDAVAAVSPASARDYSGSYGVPPERIVAIPVGTPIPDSVDRESARRHLAAIVGSPLRGPVVLHVGSFTPEKDHETLLRAFARLAGRGDGPTLVLAGDGALRGQIEALAGSLGTSDSVHFTGSRRDLERWMAGADLLVLSSRIEGVPGAILEAAARGLPVVATDVGSVTDAVIDGKTGLLVPPGDPEALASAVERLLDDAALRSRMGAAAREQVRERFALDRVVERFESLYRTLVEGGGS